MAVIVCQGRLWIGTSGFSYPHWGKGVFYPNCLKSADWLGYYSRFFNTVELNNTFYRLPSATVLTRWRTATPPNFIFAVKASRYITHLKRLQQSKDSIAHFLAQISMLKEKLGPILFQLPPSLPASLATLDHWLDVIDSQSQHLRFRTVLEVRHPSWLIPAVLERLKQANVVLCLADGINLSVTDPLTADFVYIRRHGPGSDAGYTKESLQADARRMVNWQRSGRDVYLYFNNDACGYAVANAQQLKTEIEMLNRAWEQSR
ncbi:MAG: DUF72 domain-containing protein [Cyanobacteria bacterium J06648_16]